VVRCGASRFNGIQPGTELSCAIGDVEGAVQRFLRRYWGLAVLALLLFAWTRDVGSGALLVLSGVVTFWAAFQAPAWCGAVNRSGAFCRNNSSGVLLGCHLREHKWQKLRMAFYSKRWQAVTDGMWRTPPARFATVTGVVGIATTAASAFAAVL
jgi:hypothetical protein